MKFLAINLTKESAFCSVSCLFYMRILQKTILQFGFKNPDQKIHETRKIESTHEKHFIEQINVTDSSLRLCLKRGLPKNFSSEKRSFGQFLIRIRIQDSDPDSKSGIRIRTHSGSETNCRPDPDPILFFGSATLKQCRSKFHLQFLLMESILT